MKSLSIATLLAASAATILLTASPLAAARDHVNWSINVGAPAVAYQSYPVYASPVYSAPPVVYARPQTVYVEPVPVYFNQPQVLVVPGPAYQPVYYGYYGPPRYWHHGHHGHHGNHGNYGNHGNHGYYSR